MKNRHCRLIKLNNVFRVICNVKKDIYKQVIENEFYKKSIKQLIIGYFLLRKYNF